MQPCKRCYRHHEALMVTDTRPILRAGVLLALLLFADAEDGEALSGGESCSPTKRGHYARLSPRDRDVLRCPARRRGFGGSIPGARSRRNNGQSIKPVGRSVDRSRETRQHLTLRQITLYCMICSLSFCIHFLRITLHHQESSYLDILMETGRAS